MAALLEVIHDAIADGYANLIPGPDSTLEEAVAGKVETAVRDWLDTIQGAPAEEALLGLATTADLLNEIDTRLEVEVMTCNEGARRYHVARQRHRLAEILAELDADLLGYRTADHS